ncbi:hypothetical protein QMK19_39880 [Streptomyces sp. H10-C2]|uniref:DNA polymerase Y family protein n=1 Tax=unclassified Streptomyces TaxID=2593676 RepID=UPI0024BB96DF|nr:MULTISPECIES: hypothetical protein [unclassified Streptomyces]MDJ0347052.1 hypothetical protein [Streptomyces sp. PH10-H1]MDJ0375584.1 hypothetical protein [Streptomyces sp. H10-C2]
MEHTSRHIIHAHLHTRGANPEDFEKTMAILEGISPCLQALPPDSADLDVTAARRYFDRDDHSLAELIRLRVLALLGLQVTLGCGPNRRIASMACAATPPGGITVIDPDPAAIEAFLRPQPINTLPSVGPATAKVLARHGLQRAGDLADTPLLTVQRLLGAAAGRALHERAHAVDPRPVTPQAAARSLSAEHDFPRDELQPSQHRRVLLDLSDQLGTRLRTEAQIAGALALSLRYADRSSTTRTCTLVPTAHSDDLRGAVYRMYAALNLQRARVRCIALRAEDLRPAATAAEQLTLDQVRADRMALEPVIDRANARFGSGAVRPATLAPRRPAAS